MKVDWKKNVKGYKQGGFRTLSRIASIRVVMK